jgi:hypothetical protein
MDTLKNSNYSAKSIIAQIALYFVQEQGESAEFIGINEHFPDSDWAK